MRVVGNDAETSIGCVFFHDPSQGHLRSRGHGVGFVKDDELERGKAGCTAGSGGCGEDLLRAAERLYLFAEEQAD